MFLTFTLFSQNSVKQYSFRSLDVNKGLSQNSVVSIAQDSIGCIWFATQDGLNKYDGKQFKIYNRQFLDVTRPTYSHLGQLYKDDFGDLWIHSSSNIIERYNYNTTQFDSISLQTNITKMYRPNNKKLWLGTLGSGILEIDLTNNKVNPLFPDELNKLSVFEIIQFKTHYLIGTSNGIYELTENKLTRFVETFKTTISALEVFENKLIIGTYQKGIQVIDLESKKIDTLFTARFQKDINVQDILVDSKSRIWIATYGNGVFLKEPNDSVIYNFKAKKNNRYELYYDDILKIFEDNSGTIWFGTDGQGLSYYDKALSKFNVLTKNQTEQNISVDIVRAIATTSNNIWLGTSGKGLTLIDRKNTDNAKTFTIDNSNISSNRIMSLSLHNDRLWIGYQGKGLQYFKNNVFTTISYFNKKTIWKILNDSQNYILIATRNNGVYRINKEGKISNHWHKNNSELSTNNIRTLTIKNNNTIYLGSEEEGVFSLNILDNTITSIAKLPDPVKSLLYHENVLYVGTNGNGLKILDTRTNQLKNITDKDGLPNNVIYGLLMDDNKNLWLSSNRGISRIDLNNQLTNITNYSNYDGIQSFEFNTGAYAKSNDGTLFFGGIEGINWFNPSELVKNSYKPKTIISKISLFNMPLKTNKKVFPSNKNTFTFHFSSLQFSQPDRNLYKYKLEPYNKNWVYSGNLNLVNYTNLEPNDYTFYVKSSNYDGVWSDEPAKFSFVIKKPWYKTNLAYLCFIVFITYILYTLYSYLKYKWILETQVRLERAEAERLKQLDEVKTKLYANISHEFRTPLTLIKGNVSIIKNHYDEKKQINALNVIESSSDEMLALINQMLDLGTIDNEKFQLTNEVYDLVKLLQQCLAFFESHAKNQNKTLLFKTDVHELLTSIDVQNFKKIIFNLISNALKFTSENGKIIIQLLKLNQKEINITVQDSGIGIAKEHLPKIFDRYYKTIDLDNNLGSGIGMALTKELINLMGGSISVESKVGFGTKFCLLLPLNQPKGKAIEQSKISDLEKEELIIQKKYTNDKTTHQLVVVEDNPNLRVYYSQLLDNQYQVSYFQNGISALEHLKKKPCDFILSDVLMPEMDGFALCKAVKNDWKTSHIPFILVSGLASVEDKKKSYDLGVDAFLTKPFEEPELLAIIKRLLNKQEQNAVYFRKFFQLEKVTDSSLSPKDIEFIDKLQRLTINGSNSLNTMELSRELAISRTQLHRKVKTLTKMSTTEYINHLRLEKAKELLTNTKLSVSEIAYEVGFKDPGYFGKVFKQSIQKTPIAYRKTNSKSK